MTLAFGVDVQGWNSKQGNSKIMMEGKQKGVESPQQNVSLMKLNIIRIEVV